MVTPQARTVDELTAPLAEYSPEMQVTRATLRLADGDHGVLSVVPKGGRSYLVMLLFGLPDV